MRRLGILLAFAVLAAGVLLSHQRLERMAGELPGSDELLYLPNGKYLKIASLGQESVLADLVYLWAIQYYSIYEREDRFRYVEHVFGDVIAELDPHYIDAYWMGALILAVEARDLEAGLRLLDAGFARNPEAWVLPYLAGWECYHARQFERASAYFGVAEEVPGAPRQVQRMEIGMVARSGDYRAAIRMWTEVLEDSGSDPASRAIAERQLRSLRTQSDLQVLGQAVARFRTENGRLPSSLAELLRRSYIRQLPRDSTGSGYLYDPHTGRVSAPHGSRARRLGMILPQEPLASIFLALLGLVLGSFLNVCIHRLPLGQSVVSPGSRCPSCKSPIRWYRNVPILSWIVLRGRCASCAAPISWRYPFVEALSGALVLGGWHLFGPTPAFPIVASFSLAMVCLFFTDLDHQLLPDTITLSGLAAGLALAWFNPFLNGQDWARVWAAGAGAALGSGLLWAFGALYTKLRGVEAMGMGDVKMMAMVGAFTGPFGVLLTIFAASLVGALVGILLIPLRGRSLGDTLPFGCFLAPAALGALLFGRQVAEAYMRVLVPLP